MKWGWIKRIGMWSERMDSMVSYFRQSGQDKESLRRWHLSRNKGNIFERTAFKAELVINAKILRGNCAWQVEGRQRNQFGKEWPREKIGEERWSAERCRLLLSAVFQIFWIMIENNTFHMTNIYVIDTEIDVLKKVSENNIMCSALCYFQFHFIF